MEPRPRSPEESPPAYQPPDAEVIALDCEISAYAPVEDDPLP